jgi:hypothetical protein
MLCAVSFNPVWDEYDILMEMKGKWQFVHTESNPGPLKGSRYSRARLGPDSII